MNLSKILLASLSFFVLGMNTIAAERETEVAERVAGASLLEGTEDLQSVLFDVIGKNLTQSEVNLLIANEDAVFDWANDNAEQWLSADDAENPWKVINSFPVWRDVDISGAEFVAIVSKLMFHTEYENMSINAESIIAEKEQMASFLESPELPAEARPQVEAMIKQADEMIYILENVLPENKPVFAANKEDIDAFLARMETVGDAGGFDEAGESENTSEVND